MAARYCVLLRKAFHIPRLQKKKKKKKFFILSKYLKNKSFIIFKIKVLQHI